MTVSYLDDERRHRTTQQDRKPSRTAEAFEVLKSAGWTSKTFADVASALEKEEREDRTLQKVISKTTAIRYE
jgi:Holliday junction resolvasome RuvABC DNA-binding subunit